jgi:membrane fusion protein, multidrug efflux system
MSDHTQGPHVPPGTPPSGPQPAPRRSSHASWFFGIGLLAVAVAAGFYWYQRSGADGAAPPASAAMPPPEVTVSAPLQREITEWDEYTGQFSAVDFVEMRPRVSGYIESVHFKDGQLVNAGDLLYVIDPRPFEIALASARAQLENATAQRQLAQAQLVRAERLRKNDFVAASTYDERLAELRSADAAVESANAAIRSAELDLQWTRVTAPISGRIGRNAVTEGNLVVGGSGVNATLLTTIVTLDPIYLDFDMSESDFLAYQRASAAGRMKSTRDSAVPVFARLFDEDGWSLKGNLDFVDNRVDRDAGTMRGRAVFANPNALITPGQFGRLRIPGSEPYQAILIPDSAIVTDQSRKLVLTVGADGTVAPKMIRPGPFNDELGLRIVREGLAPGDQIVINGLMRARPGAKVTPIPGKIEPMPGKAPQSS